MEVIKLISVDSSMEAEMIMEVLSNNDIPAYPKDNGAGEYFNVSMGYSVFGTDIYIRDLDFEKATDVLKELNYNIVYEELEKNEENEKPVPNKVKTYTARVMVGVLMFTTIIFLIVGYLL